MIERIYPRKVICRGRKRPSALSLLSIVLFVLACLLGVMMQKAQATRTAAIPQTSVEHDASHRDIAGSITLAEMIELQRIKRARAAPPLAAAEIAPAPAAGGWEVQFGAFASVPAARELQNRLQAQSLGREPALENIAGLYRVRSVVADQPAAQRLCERARAADFACFVRAR